MKAGQKLDSLIDKAKKVAHQNKGLHSKVQEMEAEVKSLRMSLEQELRRNDELLNKIKIIKLAQNIGAPGAESAGVTELKRKINEYIKEIDHCINMLND